MEFEDDFFRNILESLEIGIYFTDRDRKIAYWNRGAERITGYTSAEVIGRRCADNILSHVDDEGRNLCESGCPIAKAMQDGKLQVAEIYLHHKDGYRVPVSVRAFPVRDTKGNIVGAVEMFNENTARLAAIERIEELEKLAYIDHLTGLANRRYAEIELRKRLDEMQRYGWPFGVIMIDIDHFKLVNDRYGHEVGDRVLVMVAKTLVASSRSFDLVGRWGGEEFIIIAPNVTEERLRAVAKRLCALVGQSSLREGEDDIRVSISVGATLAQPNDTKQTLINRADRLLYQSKHNGRNQASVG